MNWKFLNLPILLFFCGYGCATHRVSSSNFYWRNYSSTLYKYKKDPNPKTRNKHKSELIHIIKRSSELNLTPPPGTQAELGYLFLQEGEKERAITLIEKESRSYPESALLMKKVHQNIEKK